MRYANLVKLGGELVEASQSDYEDYKGFLRCPECGEPVFLRKAHKRGETSIPDAFIHHKAVPEISACEFRVGRYSPEDVAASRAKAKGQRLVKLTVSLWKFLKTTLSIDLKSWSSYVQDAKRIKFLGEVVQYGEEVLETNQSFILDNTFPRITELLAQRDEKIAISPQMRSRVEKFLTARSRDWRLHCQISQEALELSLKSSAMKEIRHRLCCCLCHPKVLEAMPELLDLDAATDEWRQKFVAYMTLQVTFVFLLVDWIGIWGQK